jgi:hypothetical protein
MGGGVQRRFGAWVAVCDLHECDGLVKRSRISDIAPPSEGNKSGDRENSMTAEEARQFSRCGEQSPQFDEIMVEIDNACRIGDTVTIWGGEMDGNDQKWLREYGYTLHEQKDNGGSWWYVSWGDQVVAE